MSTINIMIAVDVEASGVNPQENSILAIGGLDLANPGNTFYDECRIWDGADLSDEALAINGFTREQATDEGTKTEAELVIRAHADHCGPTLRTWFAVGDTAAHDGYTTSRVGPAWLPEEPGGWTYQDVTGAHGAVLYEGRSEQEAQHVLDAWLVDCPLTSGGRCYTHGGAA